MTFRMPRASIRFCIFAFILALFPAVTAAQTSDESELTDEYNVSGSAFVDIDVAWIVANPKESGDSAIFFTDDGGATWKKRHTARFNLFGIHCASKKMCYAVGERGTILKTTDGKKWSSLSLKKTVTLFDVKIVDKKKGIVVAVGDRGTILRSTNSGATWASISSHTQKRLQSVHFTSTTKGWAVGAQGTVLVTENGGVSWAAKSNDISEALLDIVSVDGTKVWAVGKNGKVYASVDGGAHWVSQESNITRDLFAVYFIDNEKGFAVGAAGTLLKTMDGGATWKKLTTDISEKLSGVWCDTPELCTVVGDGGITQAIDASDTNISSGEEGQQTTSGTEAQESQQTEASEPEDEFPDLTLSDVILTPTSLTFKVVNTSSLSVAANAFQVTLHWMTADNQGVGSMVVEKYRHPDPLGPRSSALISFEALPEQMRLVATQNPPNTAAKLWIGINQDVGGGHPNLQESNYDNNVVYAPKPLPDLAFANVSFEFGEGIQAKIKNAGTTPFTGKLRIGLEWVNAAGEQVQQPVSFEATRTQNSELRASGGETTISTQDTSTPDAILSYLNSGVPESASGMRVTLDSDASVAEIDEINNTIVVPRPTADLTFENVKLVYDNLHLTLKNNGPTATSMNGTILYFSWRKMVNGVDQEAGIPKQFINGGKLQPNTNVEVDSSQFSEQTQHMIAHPPRDATHFRVTVNTSSEGFHVLRESNYDNNSVLVERPAAELSLKDIKLTTAALTFTLVNASSMPVPANKISVTLEWKEANGESIGSQLSDIYVHPAALDASASAAVSFTTLPEQMQAIVLHPPERGEKLWIAVNQTINGEHELYESNYDNNVVYAPKPIADLSVVGITLRSSQLTVRVKNTGTALANSSTMKLQWIKNAGSAVGSAKTVGVRALGLDATAMIDVHSLGLQYRNFLAARPAGAQKLRVILDHDNGVQESNEANNKQDVAIAR